MRFPAALLAFCLSAAASFAQTPGSFLFNTPSQASSWVLAHDGNFYGIDGDGFFQGTRLGGYKVLDSSAISQAATVCLETPSGTLLAVSGSTVYTYTLAGGYTALATASGFSPGCPSMAADGNYYGPGSGGADSAGVLYKLTPAGTFTLLHTFTGGEDGYAPTAPILQASDGNLWGEHTTGLFKVGLSGGFQYYPSPQEAIVAQDTNFAQVSSSQFMAVGNGLIAPVYVFNLSGDSTTAPTPCPGCSETYYTPTAVYAGNSAAILPDLYFSAPDNGLQDQSLGYFEYSLPGLGIDDVSSLMDVYGLNNFGGVTVGSFVPQGDGNFYGSVATLCVYTTCPTVYGIAEAYAAAQPKPVIAINGSTLQPKPDAGITLSWKVTNAFSDTLQQCSAYGPGFTGKVALTGSQAVTVPSSGKATWAILCGGVEAGYLTVPAVAPGLQVNASPTNAILNDNMAVTLTATLLNFQNPAPTGKVSFYAGGYLISTADVVDGVATATVAAANVPAGTYIVTATYSGDANYPAGKSASGATVSLFTQVTTQTNVLLQSGQTVSPGQTISIPAMVVPHVSSVNEYPTGQVQFLANAYVIGQATLVQGLATLSETVPKVPGGTYTISARYLGDKFNLPSSAKSGVAVTVSNPGSSVRP